jgi:dihydropteroate synthase
MFTFNCNGRLLVVDKPLVMGIINTTPDSFYEASRHSNTADLLRTSEKMLKDGATILDLGGQSTRPGSERITAEAELTRVIPAIEAIIKNFPEAFISIDSFYSLVIKEAVSAGAAMVNDISAGSIDPSLIDTVASLKVPYVLMHMQGKPLTMQEQPVYENVSREVLDFFIKEKHALNKKGISDVIIDPGFGFGKTTAHNFQLLNDLEIFSMLDAPILVGVSRKGMIYKTLGITAGEALNGTTVANTIALMKGAMLLRVHDVKEAVEAVRIVGSL